MDEVKRLQLLDPYVQWTNGTGGTVRGRSTMMAMLDLSEVPAEPASVELRDGQMYRWRG